MKTSFYPKLALDGMRKNSRLYIPYILTAVGMVAMHYIVSFLQYSVTIDYVPGAETIKLCMMLGSRVIAVFSCLFLFYTNSFLMKRRKKEFGLYSVLGMNRKNISWVLFFENLFVFLVALFGGSVFGIVFSKMAEAGLVKIIRGNITYSFSVSPESILITFVSFAVIFVFLFLNSYRQIRFSDTVSLLKSENMGEKAPKANWVLGILGAVGLVVSYVVAVSIKEPLQAFMVFFGDVIGVIIATYLLFIAGSVFVCKLLQKNDKYYYSPKHFVSLSSMTYRMKRNGAGLASICILATMVLVMISSSSCLYIGSEDSLNKRFPTDACIQITVKDLNGIDDDNSTQMRSVVTGLANKYGWNIVDSFEFRSIRTSGLMEGNKISFDPESVDFTDSNVMKYFEKACSFYVIPSSDYTKQTGKKLSLNGNEIALMTLRKEMNFDELNFEDKLKVKVKYNVTDFEPNGEMTSDVFPSIVVFVDDIGTFLSDSGMDRMYNGEKQYSFRWDYGFNAGCSDDEIVRVCDKFIEDFTNNETIEGIGVAKLIADFRGADRADFYGTYGSVLFIGIILSIIFIAAAVLIIYYKQITEGYEDAARFTIMKNVGMTSKEIRKSINSQLLSVFSIPLIAAGVHLVFAFPIITKLLALFNIRNIPLFAVTSIVSFLAFAAIYFIAYKLTSNAYYKIVNGIENE